MMNADVWHRRFMELAELISTWSKDPSSKVGAVVVDPQNRIVSAGYNGFPVGVEDSESRLGNRDVKYKMILHAEENAIMFSHRSLEGCTLYVTSLPPCSHCAALIIQSGIKAVFAPRVEIPERWKTSIELTMQMFREAGVKFRTIDKSK